MSDSPETEPNPQNTQAHNKNFARRYLRRIVVFSVVAYLILLGLSIFWPNLIERTKFFTANGLVLALLIVAIVQVLIYYKQQLIMQMQWKAMKDQAKVMRDTLEETKRIFDLTERPIVIAYNATILDLTPDHPVTAMITIINKGRTAAKNISVFFRIAKPGYIYIMYPQGEEFPAEIPFLGAGDTERIIDAPVNAITIDSKIFNSILEGREGLMIYGRGSYEDMAGRKYILDEYAFRYDAKQRGFIPDHYHPALWSKNKALEQAAAREEEENSN